MDKRALKILFDTYWSRHGWIQGEPRVSKEDFEYAKSQRVMFDPTSSNHDETISRLNTVVKRLTPRQVADSFLASLSTRRLDWRSALGSYSATRHMPEHDAPRQAVQCQVCGMYTGKHEHDLNLLNFGRFKWGGVRHSDPVYALLDLALSLEAPAPAPTAEDARIFRELVSSISTAPSNSTSATLHKHFPPTLKANQQERNQVVEILGLCGILGTPEHPGYFEAFVPYTKRVLPSRRFVDMAYPACWWTSSSGIDQDRLHALFSHVL
ncbi:hypothetical protein HF908_11015 [Ralstonia pseudosolanacearum]|uniref:Uncharacterized protein n=1 Tax=Ralstonia solanacearum TaxID=305 RepID=A0AA92JSB1_RALSL|nr:hypothetical protein [Ralstonia pseudosolanacearum]QOK91960.1 hypothetical protein HF908_11015 [Ralstonia pseudosolanacearum]QOK96951.1 hypothetical protein HF909_11230 [Ralstonia pseudosolanacearum]